jgi:hypothetical protein
VLTFFVLALHNDTRGKVRDANGAFGLVDLLSAGSSGAHGVNLNVFRSDVDLDFIGFREHCDGGSAGVHAALSFRFRDSLDAVSAAFELQGVVGAVAGDGKNNFAEATKFGGTEFEDFCFPAALGAVGFVHLVEIACEEGGLITAGTGTNFHDAGSAGDGITGGGEVFQFNGECVALGL